MPLLGNDVVDLEAPENRGKSGDRRFSDRVFTAEERGLIDAAGRPDALLWALWAAKEAAYKAVNRDDPAVCSIPRRYAVKLDGENGCPVWGGATGSMGPVVCGDSITAAFMAGAGSRCQLITGRVLTPRGELALRVAIADDYVHALTARTKAAFDGIVARVDRREEKGAAADPSDPSAFVRTRLSREIAGRLCCPVAEIEIRKDPAGPGVPRVFRRGLPLAGEISLSHDGRFTAFAWNAGA